MPKFSIIMAVYNNEKYFPMAVCSILNQDFDDFELIIVDDGSTDRTSGIADRLAEEDNRIRVIHQTNQWIYASFNNGIAAAKGEYVYIVNSDDKLSPGILRKLNDKIIQYHPDVIWTPIAVIRCDPEQNVITYNIQGSEELGFDERFYGSSKEVRENWPVFYRSKLVQDQANLYKRDIMLQHKFRNDVYSADTFFNISIAPDIQSALILNEAAYEHFIYEMDGMNASKGKYYGYEHQIFNEIYTKYRDLFRGWGILDSGLRKLLCRDRVNALTHEIKCMQYASCKLSIDEKVEKIYFKLFDEIVYECAKEIDALEEAECRILSGLREIFLNEKIEPNNRMYFVYEMLESLLRYEKTHEDLEKIEFAVNHKLNKYNLGQGFYNRLKNLLSENLWKI